MINGLKSIARQRAIMEAEAIMMEAVMDSQEVADLFLMEDGESTIEDVYSDDDVDIPSESELDDLIDNLPESDIDDEDILNRMMDSNDEIGIDDIFEACGEKK